jgi:hypothetical protein
MLATQDYRDRVKQGRKIEQEIIETMRQNGMKISNPSSNDDIFKKVDAWFNKDGERIGIQIKFRETGSDLLFEVYDKFFGFNDPNNKIGRDLQGDAKLYAVKLNSQIVMVDKAKAVDAINEMIDEARCNGWSESNSCTKTLYYELDNQELQLKLQHDPSDGRKKMVAYIPKEFFNNFVTIGV